MVTVCPECDKELTFYPDILEDLELSSGVLVCENKKCENYDSDVYDSGDFE